MEDVGTPCSVITSNGSPKSGCLNAEESSVPSRQSESKQDSPSAHHESDWVQPRTTPDVSNNPEDSVKSNETPRKRKPQRPYSPNVDKPHGYSKTKTSPKKNFIPYSMDEESSDNFVICENGQPLKCDKCHSPYAIDPTKRKKCIGKKLQKPKFRKRLDVVTNKILTLCNKCGLSMSRVSKRAPRKPLPTQEDKTIYLTEAEAFASSLAERLNEPDAKRLYCPHFKTEPCGCLQKYLKGKDDEDPSRVDERALKLIELLKTAKHLSSEKMHSTQSVSVSGTKAEKEEPIICRGIGNRHSKMFEDFVLSNRISLRDELHLCERASQRVLMYSNNFLHKELKSMKNQRIERKTGKYVKGLLKPIPDLALVTCCNDKCVQLALTHPKLLESWRLSAQGGQQEARRVLAEMLTPCGGSRSNCYKFISLVTGCSLSTISSVNTYMKKTCGSRVPPEHGLKRWWRENPKRQKTNPSNKTWKSEENQDANKMESDNVDSDLACVQIASKPTCESTLCSKDTPIQLPTPKQDSSEVQKKSKIQQIQLQQPQQITDHQILHPPPHPYVMPTSSLQHTIQQLLLSPDIGAVTVLAAPKSLSEPIQVATVEDLAKEGILIAEAVENSQVMTAENLNQMIRIYQPSSSTNPDLMQSLAGEKELTEFSSDSPAPRSEGERVSNVQDMASPTETVPSRQLLRLLEIPLSDSSSHNSGITSLMDKSQSHTISVVSSSDLESYTNSTNSLSWPGSCVRSVVILPETLMLDSSLVGIKNITQSNYPSFS